MDMNVSGVVGADGVIRAYQAGDMCVFEPREGRVLGDDKNGPENRRGRVLLKAVEIINGERQDSYGNPEDTFEEIAWVWNWWLDSDNAPITAADVAMMMALMKIAREKNGSGKTDNVVDACGYLGLYEDMRGEVK